MHAKNQLGAGVSVRVAHSPIVQIAEFLSPQFSLEPVELLRRSPRSPVELKWFEYSLQNAGLLGLLVLGLVGLLRMN